MTTITKPQAQMLATLACDVRPHGARQWKPDAVMAEIEKLRGRSLGAVICAVTRCAMDRNAVRPECISSPGSHWGDTQIVTDWTPNSVPAAERCTVCSHTADVCRMRFRGDHEFKSAVAAARDAEAVPIAERAAAIRPTLQPTAGPTERRTIEDMAAANPELHARLQRVREMLPEPPLQEPSPPPSHSPEPAVPDREEVL
jgi:hypothetical protein